MWLFDTRTGTSLVRSVAILVQRALTTHRLHSTSFLGLPYRILKINHKKELLRSLWVDTLARITEYQVVRQGSGHDNNKCATNNTSPSDDRPPPPNVQHPKVPRPSLRCVEAL